MKKVVRFPARARRTGGSFLLEVSIALGAAAVLALLLMKASLLAISGNQWASVQALTDAAITRESALANRVPFAVLTSEGSAWPDAATGVPAFSEPVTLGRLMGGVPLTGQVSRFRMRAEADAQTETNLTFWRLHSVIRYTVGSNTYVKSTSTLRVR